MFRDRVNSTTHGRVSIIPCDTLVNIYVNFQKIIAPPFPFFFLKDYSRLANSIVIIENLIRRVHSFSKNIIDFRILYIIIIISLKGNICSKTYETRLFLVERERSVYRCLSLNIFFREIMRIFFAIDTFAFITRTPVYFYSEKYPFRSEIVHQRLCSNIASQFREEIR